MDSSRLWAGVCFSAQGGRTEKLLQRAAENHLRLRAVRACDGGFAARCAACRYRRLAQLARRCHVRLQITRRQGLYFSLRGLLRRTGLFAGLAVFGAVLLLSQNLIWSIRYQGAAMGSEARAAALLRQAGIEPGAYAAPQLLRAGRTLLLENSTEFGWVSLNFAKGRLTVETSPAAPVPVLYSHYTGCRVAAADALLLTLQVDEGTAAVQPGQMVFAGQVLIQPLRTDRKGSPVSGCTAGKAVGQFRWQYSAAQPLHWQAVVPVGKSRSSWQISLCGAGWRISGGEAAGPASRFVTRHYPLELLGFALPAEVCETTEFLCELQTVSVSEQGALEMARCAMRRALEQAYPGASQTVITENSTVQEDILQYSAVLQVTADILRREDGSI